MSYQNKVVDNYADRLLEMFRCVPCGFEKIEFSNFVNESYEVVRNYKRNKAYDYDDFVNLKATRDWCIAYLNLDKNFCNEY